MNQQAIDWLLSQEPETAPTIVPEKHIASNSDDPFGDIPVTGQEPKQPQPTNAQPQVKNDLFADIPVTPQAIEQEPSLWGQIKAGAADVASSYYMDKARREAEAYQRLKLAEGKGLLGGTAPGLHGISFGGVSAQDKEQELKEREEDIAGYIKKSQEYQNYSQNMPMPESVRNFLNPNRNTSWWEDFKEAPIEIATNVTAKSLPASVLSLGGTVIGGLTAGIPGAMGGGGFVSGRMEYANSIMEGLHNSGIDLNDTQAFINAINNDEIMDPIREKALKRGVAIGTFDSLAGMLGGKVIAPKSLIAKSAGKAQAINMPAQMVGQTGLGAGGEAAGQLWSEGEITDTRAIAAEAVGELTFAPVEAGSTLLAVTRGTKGINEDRLKATNELLEILNKKRQKAYNSGDAEAIKQASNEYNEYLNIRQELESKLNMSDTESLYQSLQDIETVIEAKKAKYFAADPEKRPELEKDLTELTKRRDVVFNALHTKGSPMVAEEAMSKEQALDEVKAEREIRRELQKAQDEEIFRRRTNPLAAAEEEAKRIAEGGGDSLDQQIGASNAYGKARSETEMAEEMAEMESALNYAEVEPLLREQLEAIKTYQSSTGLKKIVAEKKIKTLRAQIEDIKAQRPQAVLPGEQIPVTPTKEPIPTDTTGLLTEPEPYQPKSLYQIVREGKERRVREGDWDAALAQQQQQTEEQTASEIALWEKNQGITEQEQIAQRKLQRQRERLHNELVKELQAHHQQAVIQANQVVDEAIELGLIDDEATARQAANNGEIPTGLIEQVTQQKRLLAREKQESDREAFVEKQAYRKKIARIEQHIAEQQKTREYELMEQQADQSLNAMTEAEIAEWEDYLGIPHEEAQDTAASQRQQRQAEQEATQARSPEELQAERVRLAHQEIDAALKNGELGLLGEPLARQYADQGEVPPQLAGARQRLDDQISKLEQHIEQDKKKDYLRNEVSNRRPFVMKIVKDWAKKSQEKKAFVEQEATHIFSDPESGERIPVIYFGNHFIEGLDLYQDIDGNEITGRKEQFTPIPGRESPTLIPDDESDRAYWEEQDRLAEEEKQAKEQRYQEEQRRLSEEYQEEERQAEARRQAEKERREANEIKEREQAEKRAKAEEERQQHIKSTGQDIAAAKQESADLRNDPDLTPKPEPTKWSEIKDKVLSRFGNAQARKIPWARKLEDAYRQDEQWQDTLTYADENIAIFTGKRKNSKVIYVVKQPDAADFIAWANVSGKKETSPTTWDKNNIESIIESWELEKGGYVIVNTNQGYYIDGHGFSSHKIYNPGEHDKRWSGGWRGAYTRVHGLIGKNGGLFQEQPKPELQQQKTTLDENAQFESQLKQIGKEWIKDKQHRFYFNDIIKELSGTDQNPPANAKLWYDKRTGFYGSENLDDAVYESAVERLELLRQSIIEEHGAQALEAETSANSDNESIKSLNNDLEESTQSLEDLKALHQDLIKQRNEAEYNDIQAGRIPTGNARLDDRIRQTENAIKQVEKEQPAKVSAGIRGFINESGSHTFNKEDGSTETLPYNRVADSRQVSAPSSVAEFILNLKEGDLFVDKFNNRIGIVSHAKGGKVHFKNEADPYPININVHKDDKKKLGEEIRRLKAEQKGKTTPKQAETGKTKKLGLDIDHPVQTPKGVGIITTKADNKMRLIIIPDQKIPGRFIKVNFSTKELKPYAYYTSDNYSNGQEVRTPWGNAVITDTEVIRPNRKESYRNEVEIKLKNGKKLIIQTPFLNEETPQAKTTQQNKPTISSKFNTPLESGKYKGKTINEIGLQDRGYLRELANSIVKDQKSLFASEWLEINGLWSNNELASEQQTHDEKRNKPLSDAKFNTPLEFGKYKGKTINEIGQEDRGYLRWLSDTNMKRNFLISDHAGEWLDTNGLWSKDELNDAATLVRDNILNNEDILSGKEISAEITRPMGNKDQVITISPYPNHLQINTTTYTTKYGGRSRQTGEQTRRNEYTYKALSEVLTDQEVNQLKKLGGSDKVKSPPNTQTIETTTDENTGRTGQGTLEGVSTGALQGTGADRGTGEGSADRTSQGSRQDDRTDGHDELRGSETTSVSGTDIHTPGGFSNTRTDGDRRGGINSPSADYVITETEDYNREKFKTAERFRANIDAIKLLKELGPRPATPEQKKILAKYVGWGGMKAAFYRTDGTTQKGWEKQAAELKALLTPEEYDAAFQSTQNAHYTSWPVINAIFTGLEKIGFTGGRILEPSVGVGNFFGMMPPEMRRKSRLIGVELDHITGGIADKLYGNSARIHQPRDFADFDFAEGTYDIAVGNPPFGETVITDLSDRELSGHRIHNYFFLKSMKALRPGGVLAMVVSKGFMDSSDNQEGREKMFKQARLLGAWRLPNEAFGGQANTDVTTDIIFLQKREEPLATTEAQQAEKEYQNTADFVGADGSTMKINEYFVANPENLLGDMVMIEGRYSRKLEPTMNARKGLNWKTALKRAMKRLQGKYRPEANVSISEVMGKPEASTDIHRAEVNGLYITDNGELYRRLPDLEDETQGVPLTSYVNAQGNEVALKGNQIKILKDAVALARTARELINLQVTDITDPELEPLRTRLNQQYDQFVKKYKMINRPYNKGLLFRTDITISPLLMALENHYQKEVKQNKKLVRTESSTKADIFTQRTQEPYREVSKVNDADQALLVALSQTGRVDLTRMADLSGISQEQLIDDLKGQIFNDPVAGWVTRDEYLSGNVKLKLRQAEEAGLMDYAKALQEAIPADVPATDIVTVMGAHWQTPEVINEFWKHLGGTEPQAYFVPERNLWEFKGQASDSKKWRTAEKGMLYLFDKVLNNKAISVTYKDAITGKSRLDVRATDAAMAKADEIRNEFNAWLWRDEQRREAMVRRYNDLVNTHKNRQYDGSFLSFPGMTKDIDLYDTQKNAIWRMLQSKTTLLDHIVGAGKTFTMIAGAMEMRRTGLAKKPMFVVPNHLVGQWAEYFARLYPNARVLAATKDDFNKHKRKEFLARVATGDWDAVIVAHSSFGKMPTDPQTEHWFLKKQIKDAELAIDTLRKQDGKDNRSVGQIAKARDALKEKLKKSLANTDKDQGMTWAETGVDALFVDEAHEFKNLSFLTSMDRVKNINPQGSNKAMDLFIKSQALLRSTGGRNLVFATGTPVSNSMAELFTMQRYLDYTGLTDAGVNHFDAWARTFGRTVTKQERKSSGKYGPESRFAEFINLPELIAKYRNFADTINQEDIDAARAKKGGGKITPKVKGGKPQVKIAPRSMFQEAFMGEIEYRFANMPEDPREDNPLMATNDARKAGLDMRLVYDELPDDPDSKINLSIKEMMRIYHHWADDKGTQLVFCDLSTPKKSQEQEIKAFKEKVKKIAKKDPDSRNVDKMSVTEAYEYLQYMADNEIGNAADLVEKVTIDEIDSWSSKFDVYNDIKQKLIAQGVPEDEIAFIHDANTQAQKDDLFDKVRRGDVRFLLGSTFKMGAGTNVQNRLVGLHHLDAPWRPSDLEQREGRIIRQGNELFKRDPEKFEVEILRYATEQTYDTNMWQMLEVKSLFIQQLRRGNLTDRTAQDVSGQAATAAEMKAASSGDPRIIEQVELNAAISKLDNLRTTHDRNRTQASIDVGKYTKEQNYLPGLIKRLQADQRNTLPIPVKGPALTKPDGTGFKDAKEANKWFKSQILKAAKNPNSPLFDGAEIANYRGFGVYVELGMSGKEPFIKDLMLVGQENHYVLHDLMLDKIGWDGFTVRFNNAINRIERNIEQAQERLESLPSIIAENEEIARTAFPHEEDYQAKVERNRELIEELNTEEVENPEAKWMMEYELFKKMAEDFQSLKEKASGAAKKLEYSAKQNRANRLMEMILYSGPYQQKAQAKKAMALAKEQKIVITQKAIQEAQQRADEALAKHKLSEEQKKQKEQLEPKAGGNSATTTTETTADTVTFTSADDAIAHSRDKKQAITADNGNIRLERTSLGNWQLSVAWQDKKGFDDDSIVMDTDLSLMTGGRGFSNVGDKMVLTFKEDRLPMIVRRLFNKMPLQGVVANKGNTDLSEPILRREVEGKVENPMTVDQVNDTVEDELKNLDIDVSQYVDIKIANTVEELYGPGFEPFTGAITAKSGSERPTIILIASLHKSSAEVRATLQHELIGHFGMARFISPKEKQKLLNKVKISKKALKPAWDYVEKNYGDKSLDEQAEEVVAYIAEHPHRKNSRWESIVNHIVRLMKNVGFFKQQISHDEIVSLLSSIAKVMRANGQGNLFYSIGLDENKQYYGPGIVTREQHITGIPEQLTEPIHYRRDGSAEFTSPNSNDNPTDNANRFFNTLALAENQLIQKALTQAKRKGSSAMAMLRKGLLPAMGLRQIVDTYEHIFDPMTNETYEITGVSKGNPIRHYQSYVQGMQSLKANKLAEADDVDIKWGKLAKNNPQEYNEMADIMHESTVYEVFPDKDYFEEHENMEDLKRLIATEPHEGQREALRKRMMFERERVSKYNELSQRYQAMSQEAKDVYKAVEGYYEQMWNEHQQALIDKITRSMGSNNEAITFIQELKRRFHEAKVKGPYFPLQRFGQYYLIAEDEHGVYYREQYETEAQLYDNKDEIERAGMRVLSYGLMPDFTSRKLEGVSMFADQIHVALEGDKFAHVSEVVKDEIRTEINQLALQMLPDVSAAKSMIRRRKVKGFSQNARRAFAFSAIHQSNRLTRTVYGDRMTEQLERIHDDIDSHNQEPFIPMEDRTVAAQVLSELEKQHEYIMNPKGGPIAARVTNLAFIWYLGASAGAGLINMSQTALIGIPLMGGRFGYRKTTAEITKAAKDFAKYGYNKLSLRESLFTLSKATKGLTNDEKEMIQTLIDDGTIDTTQTSTLSQIADTDLKASAQVGQDRWVKVNRLLGFFFHNAEVANREVTALATYRLARKEGQNHHQAIETARKLTFDSHFDYSGANRPRVMKSDWMKVFTIFKQYSQNMTYTLVRNFATSATLRKLPAGERKRAFKALAGILFAHATVAGTLGLPLISWIGPVLAAALGDDDDEFKDWQTLYRNWLSDLFGKDVGHAIAKGVFNGFMGTDIHARTKIDDLWIQSPNYEMSAREESMHYLLQGLGPAVSAAINFFWLGPEQIAEGNTWKGIEKMVPKFVRDGIRTYRYATEGATVGRDGYQAVIEDFTPWELSKQFMGLSPARLSEGYEARSAVKNLQSKIGSRRSELVQEYTKAYMEGDQETANRILMEIQQFNLNYPTFGITGQSLRSSLKLKYRYKDLSQSGIYLPQAQMGLLNEARFAL